MVDALDEHIKIFEDAIEILKRKRIDYSGAADPFGNFRKAEIFHVESWRGAGIRLSDKISRFVSLAENDGKGKVTDESMRDTVIDGVNYFVLMYQLYMERYRDVEYRSEHVSLTPQNTSNTSRRKVEQVVEKKRKSKNATTRKDGAI